MTGGSFVDSELPRPASGIDLIEIDRVAQTISRFGQRFLDRVFTEREQEYCRGRAEKLAGRFAAKEAVSKALGIGIRRLSWRDIEILPNREGKPQVFLHGRAAQGAGLRHIEQLEVSITHSKNLAGAIAIAWDTSH